MLVGVACDMLKGLVKDLNKIVAEASTELLLWEDHQMSDPLKKDN